MAMFAAASPAENLPDGPGKATVLKVCSNCHGEDFITRMAGMDRTAWTAVVDDMISRGATLTSAQRTEVIEYLAAHFPRPRETKAVHP
jgi:mono/diheme cytochrome c family protein